MIKAPLALTATIMLLSSMPAQAEMTKGQQSMQYDVYAGGLHALQSNLNVDASTPDRYRVDLTAKTYGLLAKMAPWEGSFVTKGWTQSDTYTPEEHIAAGTWRGETETKKYQYNKDGSFGSYSVRKSDKNPKNRDVDSKLTDKTSDVLSATLATMQNIAVSGKCSGETDVFDGKRRFKLIFKEKRTVELEASRWNVYSGSAIECTAEVKPIAGKWHEKPRGWMSIQEQGRERGTMPTIWFAKISADQPAIPVKVRVKTSYGTLFMHMTKYQTVDKTLSIKK